MSDKKFIDGFNVFKPRDNAPDFVKGDVSIDLKKFFEWAKAWKQQNPDEQYLKISIKESQKGKFYAEENTWRPQSQSAQPVQGGEFDDDIPFAPKHWME